MPTTISNPTPAAPSPRPGEPPPAADAATAKVRVAMVSHSAELGGAERALLRQLRGLRGGALEPIVVLPGDGPLRAEIEALGVDTATIPNRWWIPATHWGAPEF